MKEDIKKDSNRLLCQKFQNVVNLSQLYALNFSVPGVLDTINQSKDNDYERNLSPMILDKMHVRLFPNFTRHHLITQ